MKPILKFVNTCRKEGVSFSIEDGELRYKAPRGALTTHQLSEIRARRAEILELFYRAQSGSADAPTMRHTSRAELLPLSYSQERLWILEQIEKLGAAYHVWATVHLAGELNIDALERAFAALLERHEILRTRFAVVNGSPVQVIDKPGNSCLAVDDLSTIPADQQECGLQSRIAEIKRVPFDLER